MPPGLVSAEASAASFESSPRLSFDEAYDEYFDFVWLSLRRLGVEPAALDDATQDVFVIVHRKLDEFEYRSHIKTWLFSLALRVAQNHRRKKRLFAVEVKLEQVPARGCPPDDTLARQRALQLIDDILASLEEDRRVVFIMAEIEQLPMPAIAEALGLKLNTAYSRLRLARVDFETKLRIHRARDDWRQR